VFAVVESNRFINCATGLQTGAGTCIGAYARNVDRNNTIVRIGGSMIVRNNVFQNCSISYGSEEVNSNDNKTLERFLVYEGDVVDGSPQKRTYPGAKPNSSGSIKIWTKGAKISTKNLQRSLSILHHMSRTTMSDEDASFLAQQAGFALEENVPLEVVVQDAPLKSR